MSAPGEAVVGWKLIALLPAVAAMAYPFFLKGFHAAISSNGGMVAAAILLLGAFAMPLLGFAFAFRMTGEPHPRRFHLRARRLAYASIAAPPLFVFAGVGLGLIGLPVSDLAAWIAAWLVAGLYILLAPDTRIVESEQRPIAGWRVAHGVAAAVIACFVLFHLTNHLFGLEGPQVHKAIMAAGRKLYRAPYVEPVLVALLLFQVASGIRLAWRWSSVRVDVQRIFQIGSGAYLAAFILAHLNSALVSARTVHIANRFWIAALAAGALISTAIIAGLCGVRI